MSLIILVFFLGILAYGFVHQYPWVIIFIGLLGLLSYQFRCGKWWFAFSCGLVWIFIYIIWHNPWTLPSSLERIPIMVVGKIVGIPEKKLSMTHFLFAIEHFEKPFLQFKRGGLVRCAWQNAPQLTAGEKWQLQITLKKWHSPINPGGFDYEAWAFAQGILANASVNASYSNLKLSTPVFSYGVDRLRQELAEKIDLVLAQQRTSGLIKALIVGDQSSILEEQWKVLRQTGTNHLFAIAGLHIGFVAQATYQLCHWLSRRSMWLVLRVSAPVAAALGALCSAITYSALAGFSLPAQRAVIMLSVFLITKMKQRHVGFWNSWFIALGIILIINPLQILTESFWLSFTAVGGLIYGFYGRINLQSNSLTTKLTHIIKTQWITSVALIPLTLLLFQQASLVGFFANFIAVPWIGFLVAPLSLLSGLLLLGFPMVGNVGLKLANSLLAHFWPILEQIGAMPNSQWQQTMLTPWTLICGSIAVLLLLAPKGFPARVLACIWISPLIFFLPKNPEFAEANFTLLDVGQGLSAIVRTHQHVLVFDTGAHRKNGFDTGEAILLPFLQWSHINHVDALIISHGDNDHIGGAEALLKTLPVNRIITSVPERFNHHAISVCTAGQTWWWDGVRFEILSPLPGNALTGNNSSCVLKVTAPSRSVLLTGDIEKETEKILLAVEPEKLPADVLVAPHHGSKTSSTEAFINAVHPRVVLFPVGYRNQYHLPSPIVVDRYREKGAKLYDSVECGAIEVDLTSSTDLPVHCYRRDHRRFWRND